MNYDPAENDCAGSGWDGFDASTKYHEEKYRKLVEAIKNYIDGYGDGRAEVKGTIYW